jgi:hypothetical protein
MKANDTFDMIAAIKEAESNVKEPIPEYVPTQKFKPFDFITAVSETKKDMIASSDFPNETEKMYSPFVVNKGLSFHNDSILHANEMNMRHGLFKGAQFYYYMGALRSRKRFSKWYKNEKDEVLDLIQKYYQCNRQVAKQYAKVLSSKEIEVINNRVAEGGETKVKK